MRFIILPLITLAPALATTSPAVQPSPSDAVITINGAPVTVPVKAATALHQAFASAFSPPSTPGLAKRRDVANPAPVPAAGGEEGVMTPAGVLQICFEHWGIKVCYTIGTP
ncbi:hypothetical protein BDW66DRAFT_152130 [Aspergillus desertorum]